MDVTSYGTTAIKNGYYIPLLYPILHTLTEDSFLTTILLLKLLSANYWYWFQDYYYFLPKGYNWIKQFVRFTDSGHMVSFLYCISPTYLPLAFAIHFTISIGFWTSKMFLDMKDNDTVFEPDIDPYFVQIWSAANHGLPLILLTHRIIDDSYSCIPFTFQYFYIPYLWGWGWFFVIYMPWRIITNDPVYDLLSFQTPIKKTLIFIGYINFLIGLGHMVGYILSRC
jgi:hypothetical protein